MRVGALDHQKAKEMYAKKIIIHPDWTKGTDPDNITNYNNDIALIQLARRIELDKCICPVCLPQRGETAHPAIKEVGYVAGWGATDRKNKITKETIERPKTLEYARVLLNDLQGCKKTVPEVYTVTSNMLCAGGENRDSCRGDSGGPLMFQDLKNKEYKRLYIAGIVSWGINCGDFGMYTKVQNYVDWIEKTIEKVEDEDKDEEQPEPLKIC